MDNPIKSDEKDKEKIKVIKDKATASKKTKK